MFGLGPHQGCLFGSPHDNECSGIYWGRPVYGNDHIGLRVSISVMFAKQKLYLLWHQGSLQVGAEPTTSSVEPKFGVFGS